MQPTGWVKVVQAIATTRQKQNKKKNNSHNIINAHQRCWCWWRFELKYKRPWTAFAVSSSGFPLYPLSKLRAQRTFAIRENGGFLKGARRCAYRVSFEVCPCALVHVARVNYYMYYDTARSRRWLTARALSNCPERNGGGVTNALGALEK